MTEATLTPMTEPDNAARYRRLRILNIVVGLAFVAQVAVILKLSKPLSIPLVLGYLNRDPLINPNVIAKPVEVISIGIASSVAIFLACAALDHLLVAFPLRSSHRMQRRRGRQGLGLNPPKSGRHGRHCWPPWAWGGLVCCWPSWPGAVPPAGRPPGYQ